MLTGFKGLLFDNNVIGIHDLRKEWGKIVPPSPLTKIKYSFIIPAD